MSIARAAFAAKACRYNNFRGDDTLEMRPSRARRGLVAVRRSVDDVDPYEGDSGRASWLLGRWRPGVFASIRRGARLLMEDPDPGSREALDEGAPDASVLIVDDNAAKRLALQAMLAPLGYVVVEADSGRAALRAVLRQDFAVVLMDVRMPIMDGFETAKVIRQRTHSALTPFIFVTAFGGDATETIAAYKSGAVDFLFTPVDADVLRAKVSAFVNLFIQAGQLRRSLDSVTGLHAALRKSEIKARAVLENVADGIVTAGAEGRIESFNRSAQRLFGYSEEEVIGQPLELIVAPSHHDQFSDAARVRWRLLTAEDSPAEPTETVGCRKDGSCFPMELDVRQMLIGERTFTIGCLRDISGRKAYTDALEHRMLHDELTGLPNRALFGDRVDQALASAGRTDASCAVLVVDLDGFREINENRGREYGDRMLRAVGERLRESLRDSDTVARLGGDEFGVLPDEAADEAAAATIAWKIREGFERPHVIDEHAVDVRASIGIAFFPRHGRSTTDLLRRADLALHEAKGSGSGIAVFAADPEDQAARWLTLLSELRVGIPRGELRLHFQPKVELSAKRGTIGVEALVRWEHPEHGLLVPAQFMPQVERSELIEPLTRWVLNEALHQQRLWRDAGMDLTMAVNISARNLARASGLPDTVAELTDAWGSTPQRVILELTEIAVIDADAPDALMALNTMGERLAIDDFGTGHSSLAYLQQLAVDELKIDRSFVMNLASAPSDAVIVRSTIDLAHNLGMNVVAEGVEDRTALDMLVEYGCDSAQGYFFSPPCPADEITAWLMDSPFGAPSGVRS
jgi:diguanylate cyclase (GGDEF)-like protein/PAS domain S-box-containing protein